ncbi:MAG: portal protein [Sulfuriferula sp.]
MKKMDDTVLLGIIEQEEEAADDSALDIERDRALDYYYGRAVGTLAPSDIPNRSQYVSRDVADTVDWIMPALMKTFLAGDDVVTFSPFSAEDVPAAEQETDYVNHIVVDKNPIYEIFSVWFDDALIQKNGYVYACWETTDDIQEERYSGLMIDQVTMLTQDPGVKITGATPIDTGTVDEMGQPVMAFDVVLSRTNTTGQVKISNIPPELSRVSARHRGVRLQDAPFVGFDAYLTISELRENGYDVDDDIPDTVGNDTDETSLLYRDRFSHFFDHHKYDSSDPASRVVRVRYRWMRVDYDGDGIAELRYLVLVGREILTNEKADIVPIACVTPRIVAHEHIGRSIEEVVTDLQELKTMLTRGLIDNVVLANNGRYAVNADTVNLDDMMTSRPGGIVRTEGNPAGSIIPLEHQMLGQPVMAAIEMIDGIRETRTGVTKYNMGTDAGSLNKTATGISIINNAANQRIEWIARTFAETGVKELFGIVHALTSKHQDKPAMVRLRNKWVSVDPRDWKKRNDMTVSVGLGSINRQQQTTGIINLGTLQKEAFQAGIVTPVNVFNMASEYTKALGFKDPEKFFTHPDNIPSKPPQPDPKMEKIKADMAMAQQDQQLQHEKLAIEKQKVGFDQQVQTGTMVGQAAASLLGG